MGQPLRAGPYVLFLAKVRFVDTQPLFSLFQLLRPVVFDVVSLEKLPQGRVNQLFRRPGCFVTTVALLNSDGIHLAIGASPLDEVFSVGGVNHPEWAIIGSVGSPYWSFGWAQGDVMILPLSIGDKDVISGKGRGTIEEKAGNYESD